MNEMGSTERSVVKDPHKVPTMGSKEGITDICDTMENLRGAIYRSSST